MEYVSTQNLVRRASKQCINKYQIHSSTINAVLKTSVAKKSINLISKFECRILHALKSRILK